MYVSIFYVCIALESSYKAGMLAEEIKEERATIKTLRMELQQSKDEYTDTKNETEAIERVGVV